jgi:small conductance mechanosensitive channel
MHPPRPPVIFTAAFWDREWTKLADNALNAAIQIVAIVVLYLVLRALLYRLSDGILGGILAREHRIGISDERTGRLQTLRGLSKSLIGYVLFFVFGILLFKAIGFDIMPFITTAGVIGLAIGFGAQKLVKDVISGFFIIIDNVFVVGDTVAIGTVTGQVIEMGMRVTKIQDAAGKVYILSNGDIGTVTNLSRNPVEDFIEVTVAPTADLSKVYETVDTAGKTLFAQTDTHHLKAAPHILGISAFTATAVTLRIGVTSDPRDLPAEQMRARAAVREALLAAQIPLA